MFNFSLRSKIIFIGVICLLSVGWLPVQPASAAAKLKISWSVTYGQEDKIDYFRLMKHAKGDASKSWVWVKSNIDDVTNNGKIPSNYNYIIFEEKEAGGWEYTIDAVRIDEAPAAAFDPNPYGPDPVGATITRRDENGLLIVESTTDSSGIKNEAAQNAGTPISGEIVPPSLKEFYLGGAAKKAASGDYYLADASQNFSINWNIENAFPADKQSGPADINIYYVTYEEAKSKNCLNNNMPLSSCIKTVKQSLTNDLKNKVVSAVNTNFSSAGIYFISLGVNYNNTNYNFNSQSQGKGPLKIIINPPKLKDFSSDGNADGGQMLFSWGLDGESALVDHFEIWRASEGTDGWEQIKQKDDINAPAVAAADQTYLYDYHLPASGTYNYGIHIILNDDSYLTETDAGQKLIQLIFNKQTISEAPGDTSPTITYFKVNQKTEAISVPIGDTITMSWNVSDTSGVAQIEILKDNGVIETIYPNNQAFRVSNTSLKMDTAGTYSLSIRAFNKKGKISKSSSVQVTVANPLPKLTSLHAQWDDSKTNFHIRWTVNSADLTLVKRYEIWRAPCIQESNKDQQITGDWLKVGDATDKANPDFIDNNNLPANGGGYCYGMHVIYNDKGDYTTEKDANIMPQYVFFNTPPPSATPQETPTIDKTPPTIVDFSVNGEGGKKFHKGADISTTEKLVHIYWEANDGGGSGLAAIEIKRSNTVTWEKIETIYPGTATSGYFDHTLPANGTYQFAIRAIDKSGNQTDSDPLKVTVTAAAPTPPPVKPAPTISQFSVSPDSVAQDDKVTISWRAQNGKGGLGLDKVEIWIKNANKSWGEKPTLTITDQLTGGSYDYAMTEAGTFDFGIHVSDKNGEYTTETISGLPIAKVTVTSPPDCGTVTDIDGNTYSTVTIGSQCWMKSNMRTTKYPDGTAITKGCSDAGCGKWKSDSGFYSCPPDTSNSKRENCAVAATAGMLYQWSAATHNSSVEGAQGICPSGWHVPTDAEWSTLTADLGGASVAGDKLKQAPGATQDQKLKISFPWSTPNTGNNSSGFSALPVGSRSSDSYYYSFYDYAFFWSSGADIWVYQLSSANASVSRRNYKQAKATGVSVRCIKGSAKDEYKSTAGNKGDDGDVKLPKISNANFSIVMAQGTGEYVFSSASSPYPYEKHRPLVLLKWEMDNNDSAAASVDKFVVSRAPKNTTLWEKIGEDTKNTSGKYQRHDNTLPDATKKYQYKVDAFANGKSEPLVSQIITGPLDSDDDWIPDATDTGSTGDPNKADSDGDGLSDWEENYTFGYFDTQKDRQIHTNPKNVDTDGDGYTDYDEIIHCYSPFVKTPKYNTGCVK